VNHFRKWLDVSWGTKLVYKISYEKYEEIYKDPQELNGIKKLIETIVLKNIDKRISKLWVSDYKAYIQNLNEQHYIVVEIWWIADLDQAKEIIWKTVELEFRLPNEQEPSEQLVLERRQKAEVLLQEIKNNPDKMFEFADWRWAENIFYGKFPGFSLSQLPDIYQNNIKLLNSMEIWEFSNILEWTYANIQNQDQNGLLSNNELKWYSFFRILDKKVEEKTIIVWEDIIQAAISLWLKYEKTFSKQATQLSKDEYEYVWKDLIFNLWEIWAWQNAYDIKVVWINKKTSLWLSETEIKEMEDDFELEVDSVAKSIDKKWFSLQSWHRLLNDERIAQSDLLKIVTNFDSTQTGKVQTYKRFDATYVVYIRDQKSSDEKLYSTIKVWWVNQDEFEDNLKKTIIYDIEDVFVQDRETWKMAIGPKTNSLLNWAYFKFANVSSSQMWQPVVLINFDDAWQEIFCEITEANIGNQMAIFVWWALLTAPTIQSKICWWWAQIDGQFTSESAKELVNSLNDWALPAPLILMQEEKVSPTLWESAFTWSLIATGVWIIAIYLLMLFMYRPKKSLVALFTLIMFIVILASLLKLIDYALSLSGIAAVVLSLGMAVDANVLIFERFREELKEWKSISSAIDLAVSRSRNAIRDWQISTWLIALVLFSMWISIFKWFGSMMLVTIILTLLVNVPLTKELLKIFYIKKQ
jgi:protein-export membrane protein SecD